MNIDPKMGGKCWSCKHCEDIATQTNNEQGSYYRKCTKSGHEYIDTCRFSCSDYVWDGKDPAFAPPPPAPATSPVSSAPAPAKSSAVFKLISALLTTGIFGFLGYLLWEYTKYFLVSAAGGNATIPLLGDALALEGILILAPFVLTILWSIIRRRKIWIGGLITIIACVVVNGALGDDTTLAHMPLYLVCLVVPFILCLVAILKEKKVSTSTSGSAAPRSQTDSAASVAAPRSYTDYKCYQCAYYKVDADYNGICTRNNSLVDRYQTACKNCTR